MDTGAPMGGADAAQSAGKTNVWIGDLPADFTQEQCNQIFSAYGKIAQCRVMPPSQPGRSASALVRFESPDEAAWVVSNLNGNMAEGMDGAILVKFANEPGQQSAKGGWGPQFGQASIGNKGAGPYAGAGKPSFKGDGGCGFKGDGGCSFKGKGDGGCSFKGDGGCSFKGDGGCSFKGKGGCSFKGGGGKGASSGTLTFAALYDAVKGAGIVQADHVPNECQVHVKNLPPDTTDLDLMRLFSPFGALAPMKNLAMLNPDGSCKGVGFIDYLDPLSAQAACMALDNFSFPDGSFLGVSVKKPPRKGESEDWGKGGKDWGNGGKDWGKGGKDWGKGGKG